jgi:transcriptional regulator with XRE-family HTH domain
MLQDNVKSHRKNLGISILELARRSGVSRDVLYQIELGKKHNLELATIEKLAQTFNTTVIDLLQ